MPDLVNLSPVSVTGLVPTEVRYMSTRLYGNVTGQGERSNENAAPDFSSRVDVRNVLNEEITGTHLDIIPFVAETLKIGATTY